MINYFNSRIESNQIEKLLKISEPFQSSTNDLNSLKVRT